jgi:hypothetical protein
MARAVITQAILKTLKSAFKKSVGKENYNQPAFGKYLYGKNYESSFRSDGTQKIKERIRNLMKQENIPALTTKQTGKLRKKTEHTEATKQKLKEARLKNIAKGKGMNLPTAGLIGSKRKYVPQLDAYIKRYTDNRGIHEVMEQALRRDKQRGLLNIAFGKGTRNQIEKKQAKFLKQFQKNLVDDEFMNDYLRAATPYGKKAERFLEKDFSKLSTDKQYAEVVRNYLKSRGHSDDEIKKLFPTRFATTGHISPVRESYADWLGFGNKASLKSFEQSANPKMWNPEFGLLNIAKSTPDFWSMKAMQKGQMSPEGLEQIRRMYDAFGIQSLIRGKPIGKGFDLERQAKLIDWASPLKTKLFTGKPGTGDVDKARNMFKRMLERGDITYEEIFERLHGMGKYPKFKKGGMIENYATGGLASMIGKKALKKIAQKLSEKDLKLLMGSFFKGTKPLMSPAKKREANLIKKLGADKYRWRNVKSEVPGPKSSLERAQERAFYENTIVYPEAKKSFPYLDPENNAFIVAGESAHPITGTKQLDKFGRYQLRHSVDPKDTSPISKYSVYDWWDELTQSIRKEPKFKYVKDDKGNVIMKKVK